jgi:hypothetical protein
MKNREAEFEDERLRLGDRWRGLHEHVQKEINVRGRRKLFHFGKTSLSSLIACTRGRQRGIGVSNSCVLDGKN